MAAAASLYSATAMPGERAEPAFPSRPVRIVVGFTPGGQPDISARVIGAKLSESLGQQVIVDNRPGAGGVIGARIVADATPDGHTLLSVSAAHVIAPAVHAKLPYDTLRDFAGVTQTVSASYVLVVAPSAPVKNVQELVAFAKAKPGRINFGSAGTGSGTHFAGEMLKMRTGIDAVHVPYKGVPEGLTDTMTGRVQFFMAPLASVAALVKDGKLRALGVSAKERARVLPDVPTIAEAGFPGFQFDSWAGVLAPVKTPRPIIDKLNREIARVLAIPDVQQRLAAIGSEPSPGTPREFDQMIAEQLAIVAELARKAGIKQ